MVFAAFIAFIAFIAFFAAVLGAIAHSAEAQGSLPTLLDSCQ
jgi:hypothetical protein